MRFFGWQLQFKFHSSDSSNRLLLIVVRASAAL